MSETIFRDQNHNLWLLDKTSLVPYNDMTNPAVKDVTHVSNLYGTGLNLTAKQFKEFMIRIFSGNFYDFDQWLTENNKIIFYKPHTPINMHPIMALKFLNLFRFQKFINNNNLYEVESVNHWLQNMQTTFKDPAIRQMFNDPNSGVLLWLNELVNFVNSNPAILNPGINNIGNAHLIISEKLKRMP